MPTTTTPPWPSLYNPGLDLLHIEHRNATQSGGAYLYHPYDVFRFTLYWSLCFSTPIFFICGSYAFWNLNFPPPPRPKDLGISYHDTAGRRQRDIHPLTPLGFQQPLTPASSPTTAETTIPLRRTAIAVAPAKLPKENERTSRLVFALLVFFTFMTVGVAGAVLGSAVLGFSVYGLYRSGNFNMSTWMPLLLAAMQVLVGLLSVWPSIVDII